MSSFPGASILKSTYFHRTKAILLYLEGENHARLGILRTRDVWAWAGQTPGYTSIMHHAVLGRVEDPEGAVRQVSKNSHRRHCTMTVFQSCLPGSQLMITLRSFNFPFLSRRSQNVTSSQYLRAAVSSFTVPPSVWHCVEKFPWAR